DHPRRRAGNEQRPRRLDGHLLVEVDLGRADVADRGVGPRAGRRAAGGEREQEGRVAAQGAAHRSISGATMSRLAISATRSATMQPFDLTWMIFIALNEPVRKRAR